MDPEVWPLMLLLVEEADTEPVPEELLVEERPLLPVLQAHSRSCIQDVAAGCGGYKPVPEELLMDAMQCSMCCRHTKGAALAMLLLVGEVLWALLQANLRGAASLDALKLSTA